MARLTTADLKGDTAKGARIMSNRNAKFNDKQRKRAQKQKSNGSQAAAFKALDMTPDWDQVPELVELDFGDYAECRQQLHDEIEFRKAKLKEIDETIMSQLAVSGLEKVTWENRPVQIVHSNSGSKVKPEKLLMLGVPADTIAKATEPGKPYDYLLMGKVAARK